MTFFSLRYAAGEGGSILGVFGEIKEQNPDAWVSIGKAGEDEHWPTLFTGVLLLNFFYWCSNQQIIQRTFGAKNLAEGQKGVLLAAFFKILAPFILVLPGIIALHIASQNVEFQAGLVGDDGKVVDSRVYGSLVRLVLPGALTGFFAAVVVGSILSTFNSVLNSSATLFSLGIYKKHINPDADHASVVRSGRVCSAVVAVLAAIAAPIVFMGKEGIFNVFQNLNGVYFIPLLAVILVGMFNRNVGGRAALITLLLGLVVMLWGTFFDGTVKAAEAVLEDGVVVRAAVEGVDGWVSTVFKSGFHFMGAVFAGLVVLLLALGQAMRRETPYVQKDAGIVDLTPWKYARPIGIGLIVTVLLIYLLLRNG